MFVNALNDAGDSSHCAGQVARQRVFIGYIGRMHNMLFKHDDARAASCACRVVVGVLLAQKVVPREIGSVAAENNAVPGLARPNYYGLEEFIWHDCLSKYVLC